MVKIHEDGRMEKKKCKVEEEDPASDWNLCHRLSRLKGLSPQVKSFNFELLHRIYLPDQVLKLQNHTDARYELPTILVLCTGLEFIWRNIQEKKATAKLKRKFYTPVWGQVIRICGLQYDCIVLY